MTPTEPLWWHRTTPHRWALLLAESSPIPPCPSRHRHLKPRGSNFGVSAPDPPMGTQHCGLGVRNTSRRSSADGTLRAAPCPPATHPNTADPTGSPLPMWGFAMHSGLPFPTQYQRRMQHPAVPFLGSEPTCPTPCPALSTHSPTSQQLSPIARPRVGPAMGLWGHGATVLELTFSCRQLSILLLWSNMGAAVGAGRTPLSPRVPPCAPRPALCP